MVREDSYGRSCLRSLKTLNKHFLREKLLVKQREFMIYFVLIGNFWKLRKMNSIKFRAHYEETTNVFRRNFYLFKDNTRRRNRKNLNHKWKGSGQLNLPT